MPRYRIKWDAGYGEYTEIITADSLEEAENEAYSNWLEAAEQSAYYEAEEIE